MNPADTARRSGGNFFEDFSLGQEFRHAIPRTVTSGDVALYNALSGARFAINASVTFARACGLPDAPLDDLLVFNMVSGRTVTDIGVNALRSLGYAELRFGACVYTGDTLHAVSTIIGLREGSGRQNGIVWARSRGLNQRDELVVEYVRWLVVERRTSLSPIAPPREAVVPELQERVPVESLVLPSGLDLGGYDTALAGGSRRWGDYTVGERIDHFGGVTIEEAEQQMAARLYSSPARVHFDRRRAATTAFGRRVVYSGHVLSLIRALTFEGLANAFRIAAINAGRMIAPVGSGDTLYAWSEIVERTVLPERDDVGALRVRTVGVRDHECHDFPDKTTDGKDHHAIVLDIDYTVLVPR
jgi:2-methylfumaryl-CoA hydratase